MAQASVNPRKESNSPLVSILIPVYNRAALVRSALESSIQQTYQNLEIIVVDNASTDKTWATLEEYSAKDGRIKLYKNAKNIGPVGNWRRCIELATGEYVKFLWSDDWMADNYLEVMVQALERDPSTAWAFSATEISKNGSAMLAYRWSDKDCLIPAMKYMRWALFDPAAPVSPGCAVFRREAVATAIVTDIPNTRNLDFSRYGAGTDLLMMLLPLLGRRAKTVYYSAKTRCGFLSHDGSFTMSTNLERYYECARIDFLNRLSSSRFSVRYYLLRFKRSNEAIVESLPLLRGIRCNPAWLLEYPAWILRRGFRCLAKLADRRTR